jgi:integrase
LLDEIGLTEKIANPFAKIRRIKEASHAYISKFDYKTLMLDAERELKGINETAYVTFILALCQCLRLNEIDKILWEQVDFENKTLSIYQTKLFTPKSAKNCKTIPLTTTAHRVLLNLKNKCMGGQKDFILKPEILGKVDSKYRTYRCNGEYDKLKEWLRSKGINEESPIHTLRKEGGSIMYRQTGDINAVRAFLRDESMSVVIGHYVDSTAHKAPSFDI